jgi:hypothetical protein
MIARQARVQTCRGRAIALSIFPAVYDRVMSFSGFEPELS